MLQGEPIRTPEQGRPSATAAPTSTPTPQPTVDQPIPLLESGGPVNLRSINMLDSNRGWGISGAGNGNQHVLRTDDGGRTWYDVSPPVLLAGSGSCGAEAYARFSGVATAWVGYARPIDPEGEFCDSGAIRDLWKTEDGGLTWSLSSFVQRNVDTFGGIGSGFPLLEFVDDQHGWAWRSFFLGAGSSGYELHRTSDGGRTWQLLPDDYIFRVTGMDFLDRQHGWTTRSYPFGYFPPLSLGQTHDGGLSWEIDEIPLPEDIANFSSCTVLAPQLRSPSSGEVTVSCSKVETGPAWYRYSTGDGGQSWQIQQIPDQPEQHVSDSAGWRRQTAPDELQSDPERRICTLSWTSNGGRNWSEAGRLSCDTDLDFVSDRVGWALSWIDDHQTELLRTDDGGRSWEPVQPVTVESPLAEQRIAPPRLLPVGQRMAISSQNLGDLELIQELPASGVTALASQPPREVLIAVHSDGTATFWNPVRGGYGGIARLHDDWIYDAIVAQYTSLLATASRDGHLKFWQLNGNVLFDDLSSLGGEVSAVATGSGVRFASAGQDRTVRVWDFAPAGLVSANRPAEPFGELHGHQAWVWEVAMTADGSLLASGSADRSIRIWQVETGEPLATLTTHQATVGALEFSPDGRRLASGGWDGSLVLWDTGSWMPLQVSFGHVGRIRSVSFSSDGTLFASGADDGILRLWSAESGELLKELAVGTGAINAVYFTPDGRLLLAAGDGLLRLWGVNP